MTFAYLAGAFSPYISPEILSTPALLGLAFPIVLFGEFLVFLYWLIRRRWHIVAGLLLVFLVSWQSITTYLPIHRNAREKLDSYEGQHLLKVVSYNVCGFGFAHHKRALPNKVMLYLKNSDADIICLQEASIASNADWGVTLEQIKSYMGSKYPYIRAVASQARGSMLMIISRYPIKSAKRLEIDSETNGAVHFTLSVGGQETHVLNLHLESFRLHSAQGKEYMKMVARGEAFELETALDNQLVPVLRKHSQQAKLIQSYARGLESDRLIICGDFNDTPISYARHTLAEGLTDCYVATGNGFGFSFASRTFVVRIDHILAGKAFTPIYTEVESGVKGSDHYPIVTYLATEPPTND